MAGDKQSVFDNIIAQDKAAFERWYQGDPFGYLDIMADEMTYFSPFVNSILDGKSTVYAAVAPAEGQIHTPGFAIIDPKIQLGEDIAVFTFILSELDESGAQTAGWKVTEVYRDVDDRWQMIHAHFSAVAES
jgi:hypothetical protein